MYKLLSSAIWNSELFWRCLKDKGWNHVFFVPKTSASEKESLLPTNSVKTKPPFQTKSSGKTDFAYTQKKGVLRRKRTQKLYSSIRLRRWCMLIASPTFKHKKKAVEQQGACISS